MPLAKGGTPRQHVARHFLRKGDAPAVTSCTPPGTFVPKVSPEQGLRYLPVPPLNHGSPRMPVPRTLAALVRPIALSVAALTLLGAASALGAQARRPARAATPAPAAAAEPVSA